MRRGRHPGRTDQRLGRRDDRRRLCGETCLVVGTETGPFDAPMAYVISRRGHAFWVYSFDCGVVSRDDTT